MDHGVEAVRTERQLPCVRCAHMGVLGQPLHPRVALGPAESVLWNVGQDDVAPQRAGHVAPRPAIGRANVQQSRFRTTFKRRAESRCLPDRCVAIQTEFMTQDASLELLRCRRGRTTVLLGKELPTLRLRSRLSHPSA